MDFLFAHRGSILVLPALLAAVTGQTTLAGFLSAVPLLIPGLLLRCWATAHLGGVGRTRSPAAPRTRVVSGPYLFLRHPIYVGNLAIALGLLLVLRPPGGVVAGLVFFVLVFYAVLAIREDLALVDVEPRAPQPSLSGDWVIRYERSTWAVLALVVALGCC